MADPADLQLLSNVKQSPAPGTSGWILADCSNIQLVGTGTCREAYP